MKKFLMIILLGFVFAALTFSMVLAKPGKVNLEGEIIAVGEAGQTITIQTTAEDGEEEDFEIHFPTEYVFNFTVDDEGTFVHVKGELQEDGTILAEWVKPVDIEEDDDGSKEDSAYCSGEKEKPHPAALFLAHTFGKEIEEIMGYFCDGFGFGQISLALQTEKVTGIHYGVLLAYRADGQGWGEIWEDLGYNGKPKSDEKTPPGQEKTPPGQDKDKDKDKGPDDDDEPKVKDKSKEKKPKKDKKEKKEK